MSRLFDINRNVIFCGSKKDMCIEKKEFKWVDSFEDFPIQLRLKITEGAIADYMTFSLLKKEGITALYKSVGILGEKLVIVPKMPEELKNGI